MNIDREQVEAIIRKIVLEKLGTNKTTTPDADQH